MSISTSGGDQRRPNSVTAGAKPGAKSGKTAAKAKSTTAPPKKTSGAKAGGSRKTFAPVKVNQGREWGPIALFVLVGVLVVGIIGFGAWSAFGPDSPSRPWQDRAAAIDGIVNYNETAKLTAQHTWGPVQYEQSPPVGGDHIYPPVWQQCMGNVYDSPIPNEHAVHSLEHGAVWLTYRSDLPADQVAALATKIEGKEFTMMSPVEGLDAAVSLQAWGYQLKLDDVADDRIDKFISALRQNATQEPGATCSQGTTAVGTTPLTEQQVQEQFGQGN